MHIVVIWKSIMRLVIFSFRSASSPQGRDYTLSGEKQDGGREYSERGSFNAIADYQIIEFEVNKAVEKFQELLDK